MFKKEEKSTFKYWFAHWCAFNMTALTLKCWHPRFLLHDIEKPWMKLFFGYKKTRKWHRENNPHHLEYIANKIRETGQAKGDWLGLVIDWECGRYTKEDGQMTARETLDYQLKHRMKKYKDVIAYDGCTFDYILKKKIIPILDILGI